VISSSSFWTSVHDAILLAVVLPLFNVIGHGISQVVVEDPFLLLGPFGAPLTALLSVDTDLFH